MKKLTKKGWKEVKAKLSSFHPETRIVKLQKLAKLTDDLKIKKQIKDLSEIANEELSQLKQWTAVGVGPTPARGVVGRLLEEEKREEPNLEETLEAELPTQTEETENNIEGSYTPSNEYVKSYDSKKYDTVKAEYEGPRDAPSYTREDIGETLISKERLTKTEREEEERKKYTSSKKK